MRLAFYIFGLLVLCNKVRGAILNMNKDFEGDWNDLSKSRDLLNEGKSYDSLDNSINLINKDWENFVRKSIINIVTFSWYVVGLNYTDCKPQFWFLIIVSISSVGLRFFTISYPKIHKHFLVIQRVIEFSVIVKIMIDYFIK